MYMNINELGEDRISALEQVIDLKRRVVRAYNKHVKAKHFDIGDLVWKTILPINADNKKFGKWSSNWEGPYLVMDVLTGNGYRLMDIDEKELPRSINGKYL